EQPCQRPAHGASLESGRARRASRRVAPGDQRHRKREARSVPVARISNSQAFRTAGRGNFRSAAIL
ncbi:MAG: Transcriptional regulator, Xre family, partial [uncultured Sphingosinicella sp.]